MSAATPPALTRKDFQTDQDVRWCPGCGDYSILAAIQKTFPELGIPREKFAIVSGIGCSSRFPYYMNTYGFHTIHGRPFPVATGLKAAQPDLHVWVVTGDGDALSIGGNHLMHTLRRNVDLRILLFNNRIYGLTKGQYSPTSELGKKTRSTPSGSIDPPVHPIRFALGCGATFIARSIDREPKHMVEVFHRAAKHRGSAFVELYQNCNIFNDGAFQLFTEKDTKAHHVLPLAHGEPLVFGREHEYAVVHEGFQLRVVKSADVGDDRIVRHDEHGPLAYLHALTELEDDPDHPVSAIGVLRAVDAPVWDELLHAQVESAIERQGPGDLQALLTGTDTWTV
ncbi:MAG: 2-oxoacid:ferredoxin oxidoreductase subunit beta [Deltaproteobacteria bacterium]|nr:MAG: 2-oxoacid:ferredoxin oxidoreductase subunit beta [Deltaproteobacteria bacterium]